MELIPKIKRFAYYRGREIYHPIRNRLYRLKERKIGISPRYTHVTYDVAGNVGDTVLSQCVRKTFELDSPKGWNIQTVSQPVTQEVVERINSTKKLIIGGGGLFLPDTNPNSKSGWQWAISPQLLQQIQVPIVVYSVGFNNFRGQKNNIAFVENLKLLLQKAEFVGLRNYGSIQAIQNLVGEPFGSKIQYQPCTTTLIRKLYQLPRKQQTGNIALNMAFDREELRFGANKRTILEQVAKAAKALEQKGYRLYYLLHCEVDGKFVEYLQRERVRCQVVNAAFWLPHKLISFYQRMDVVLGMRGHSQMIPFGLNCALISLGTHDKMKWFLEDIQATDWYVELTADVDHLAQRIVAKFEQVYERNPMETWDRLLSQQERLWQITKKNLAQIEIDSSSRRKS